MDLVDAIAHCLSLPQATESTPFGPDTLVYKVAGKVFAITSLDAFPHFINLKCDPERAVELRDQYEAITPGWHMNKKHWNSVRIDGALPSKLIRELIEHSYQLIVKSLSAKARQALEISEE
jgi:predicted DNA-binding protein (MmcQ/YjbR family)